jgi:hypothetical protein
MKQNSLALPFPNVRLTSGFHTRKPDVGAPTLKSHAWLNGGGLESLHATVANRSSSRPAE